MMQRLWVPVRLLVEASLPLARGPSGQQLTKQDVAKGKGRRKPEPQVAPVAQPKGKARGKGSPKAPPREDATSKKLVAPEKKPGDVGAVNQASPEKTPSDVGAAKQAAPEKKPDDVGTAKLAAPTKTKPLKGPGGTASSSEPFSMSRVYDSGFGSKEKYGRENNSEGTPSLRERMYPDMPSATDRQKTFHDEYHHSSAFHEEVKHRHGGVNVSFHGKLKSGLQYFAKPHKGAFTQTDQSDEETIDPEAHLWDGRHDANYELAAAAGFDHMYATAAFDSPGKHAKMPAHGRLHGKHRSFDPETDLPEKEARLPRTYAGEDAHVQEFVKGVIPLRHATPDQLASVGGENRVAAALMAVLTGETDGGKHNTFIKQGESGKYHPLKLDLDLSFGSEHGKSLEDAFGKPTLQSEYLPGGVLDYSKIVGNVGTNFPERFKQMITKIANGKLPKGLSSTDDQVYVLKAANDLLKYGLEGTLKRRHLWDGTLESIASAKGEG